MRRANNLNTSILGQVKAGVNDVSKIEFTWPDNPDSARIFNNANIRDPLMIKYNYYFVTILALSITVLSHGQILIKADTIAVDCIDVYRTKKDKFMITTQSDYEDSEFFTNSGWCLPFGDIDFDTSILVGYRFQGSNCDRSIQWSRIVSDGDDYLIQFATQPNHVCRDLQYQLAWFILDKPLRKIDLSFERTSSRQE